MSFLTKEQISEKLLEFPLLRQLVCERWFRWAFAGFALVFIFFGLFLPKIWRTSAPGFLPVIKVSGLDLVQAWSLKRTAIKAAAQGKFDEANYAWQAALANNRADPELVRGALHNALNDPRQGQNPGQAIQAAFWLLRLTGTNTADLEITSRLLEQSRFYDSILMLLEPRRAELTPPLAAAYLKALFSVGRVDAFEAHWKDFEAKVQNDPEIGLYRAAYLVGWGPPDTMTEARQKLELATQDPAHRTLANRLKLALAARALNPAQYAEVLNKLADARQDGFIENLGYWRLLAAAGEKQRAVQLATAYPHPPSSPAEAVGLAQVYAQLGMRERAAQLLQRYASEFGQAAGFWSAYADVLLDLKRWEDLRNLALQMRGENAVRDQLGGYSHFLEGRAELALGREANGVAALQKAVERGFVYPALGLRVATQMHDLGHPELAVQVLLPLENALSAEPSYWSLLFRAADKLKNSELLLKAASHAYQLKPDEPVAVNNYAAALLITRQNPQEAIRITLPLLSQNPQSLYAAVNHSAALLLNGRPKEAEALLARIPTNGMDPTQLSVLSLDLFETYFSLGRYDQAWAMTDRIQTNRLYPTQREWFERTRKQLPPRNSSG